MDRDRIRSADLARLLAELEGRPWHEWGRSGQPITPHALARILSDAGIRPTTRQFHAAFKKGADGAFYDKGYLHDQFADAFARYLPEWQPPANDDTQV